MSSRKNTMETNKTVPNDLVKFLLSFPKTRTSGGIGEEQIKCSEDKLNLAFSEEYKTLMKNTGAVLVHGHEIYSPSGVESFTLSARRLENIHPQMYVFECVGIDDIMMLQNEKGEVFECRGPKTELVADSILSYLQAETGVNARTFLSSIREIKQLFVPDHYYSVGGYAEEALCAEKTNDGWGVYFGERGSKFNIRYFAKEADACNYFVAKIKRMEH